MEVNEILGKMRKEDRLLLESAVMLSVQKALIDMGYEPFEDKVRGVYTAIENTPIANSWIPCDENLPNHNQTVIFQTEDGMVETGYYDVNEDWCVNDSYFPNAFRFIAWQPLPEPYQAPEEKMK